MADMTDESIAVWHRDFEQYIEPGNMCEIFGRKVSDMTSRDELISCIGFLDEQFTIMATKQQGENKDNG